MVLWAWSKTPPKTCVPSLSLKQFTHNTQCRSNFFIEDERKKKTRKVKFLTMGIVGVELFCLHGYLRSRAQKGNKSARRVQGLCEGLTPSAQTLDISDSNAGSCDIIKIYIASFGWRRSCTLKMSPGTDFHPYLQSRLSEMFPDIAECPP